MTLAARGEVLAQAEVFEHTGALELAPDPQPGNVVLLLPQQGASLEAHVTTAGQQLAGDHIEKGGLAGTVGTNHRPEFSRCQAEAEIVEGKEPVEIDADTVQLQQRCTAINGCIAMHHC